MLCAANEEEAIDICCRNSISGVTESEQEALTRVATRYLREELEKNQMPMGCSAKDAKRHVNRAIDAAYERMKDERSASTTANGRKLKAGQACGFPILALFSFLSALWTIFTVLRSFMCEKNDGGS